MPRLGADTQMNTPVQVFEGDGEQPLKFELNMVVVDYDVTKIEEDKYYVRLEDPTDPSMDVLEQLEFPAQFDIISANGLGVMMNVVVIAMTDGMGVRTRVLTVISMREPLIEYDDEVEGVVDIRHKPKPSTGHTVIE